MKKALRSCFLLFSITIFLASCGTTGNGVLYTERSINPTEVAFKRVAVLPNRLPLNLTDPERWKKFNWEVMRKRFEKEGMQVIDYNTSVEMFARSGLPLEDTKVSRDKYAELAEEMSADIMVFPYYGTSYRVTGVTDKNNFEVMGSLQVYLADQNDFMTRIDFDGNNYYHALSKILPVASTGLSLIFMSVSSDPTMMIIGSLIGPVASIAFLIPALTPANKRWERAFTYSINKGLDQFFAKYSGRGTATGTPRTTAPATNAPVTTAPAAGAPAQQQAVKEVETAKPAATQNKTESKPGLKPLYYYSTVELEKMKQDAINAKDYRTAQTIKEEIDRRAKK